jgi:hypothetical protein
MTQILQRVTTEFSAEEDRIRIAGVTEEGRRVVIWLTRRLLGLLLPVLLEQLDKQFGATSAEHRLVLHEFAQQAACQSLGGAAAVVTAQDDVAVLPTTVDIKQTAAGVMLVFRSPASNALSLPLGSEVLRQWLHILYQAVCAANWQLPQWPDWLTGATANDPATPMH